MKDWIKNNLRLIEQHELARYMRHRNPRAVIRFLEEREAPVEVINKYAGRAEEPPDFDELTAHYQGESGWNPEDWVLCQVESVEMTPLAKLSEKGELMVYTDGRPGWLILGVEAGDIIPLNLAYMKVKPLPYDEGRWAWAGQDLPCVHKQDCVVVNDDTVEIIYDLAAVKLKII